MLLWKTESNVVEKVEIATFEILCVMATIIVLNMLLLFSKVNLIDMVVECIRTMYKEITCRLE